MTRQPTEAWGFGLNMIPGPVNFPATKVPSELWNLGRLVTADHFRFFFDLDFAFLSFFNEASFFFGAAF